MANSATVTVRPLDRAVNRSKGILLYIVRSIGRLLEAYWRSTGCPASRRAPGPIDERSTAGSTGPPRAEAHQIFRPLDRRHGSGPAATPGESGVTPGLTPAEAGRRACCRGSETGKFRCQAGPGPATRAYLSR